MQISFAELMRASPDALRGLGAPFGQADDAVECLVLTQCALAKGYDLLREADSPRLARWQTPRISHPSSTETQIDLRGQSLLLAAARVADYAASRTEGAIIRIEHALGRQALPYLAHRIATHGNPVAAGWRDVDASIASIVVGVPRQSGPIVYSSSDTAAWPHAAGSVRWSAPTQPVTPTLADDQLCLVVGARAADGDPGAFAAHTGMALLDFHAGRRAAIAKGLEVPEADYLFFQSLTKRIRVPTSERSRAQAG